MAVSLSHLRMHFSRSAVSILFLLLGFSTLSHAQTPPEARGVWVHENHFSDLEGTFSRLAEAGINIAYLRTWYQGRTVYPSDVVEAAGGVRQHTAFVGRDPIQEAIDVAERYGISVAAWMEYGLVAQATYASGSECPAPTGILAQNPDWSMRDRDGNIATPSSGANSLCFYWMDPAHPEVISFMADKAAEIALRYPALDIYEADRFRYPSYQWSYSDVSVDRYIAETGNTDPRTTEVNDPDYIAWRRAQTTNLMGSVYRAVRQNNPSMAVSAAVVPPYMIGGSQDKMQHWPTWADSNFVDFLEIMLYLPDSAYPNQLSLARGLVGDFPIYGGIDNSQGYDLVGQIEETRRQGVRGVVIWDGRSAIEGSDVELLAGGPFSEWVLPPHDDIRVDDGDADASFGGTWEAIDEGYAGSARLLAAGAVGEATYDLEPVRAGWYSVEGWWPARSGNTPEAEIELYPESTERPPLMLTADQRDGDRWVALHSIYLDGGQRAVLKVAGAADGDVLADAFRLVRTTGFRLVDALAVAEDEIHLLFNRALDISRLTEAEVEVAGVGVSDLRVRDADPTVLIVSTDPLEDGQSYEAIVRQLYDETGMPLSEERRTVTASFDTAVLVLDDADSGFNQQGSWTLIPDGGLDGGSFRVADGGAANRAFWVKTMPEDALYRVAVHVPAGGEDASTSAAYLVIHREGTDTVFVDQRAHAGWKELGVYRPRNQSQLYVQLDGAISGAGTIAADAVRWQRTLSTVDAPSLPERTAAEAGMPYPNPTSGRFSVPVSGLPPGSDVTVTVFDLLGRQVIKQQLSDPGTTRLDLDLSNRAAGVYLVRMEAVSGPSRAPIVVLRQVAVVR
ncbi:MAG: family 10 glycosylhydrolase [Bacteroidota bacterium]